MGGLSSKAISDKFAALKAKLAQIDDNITSQDRSTADVKTHLKTMQNDIKILDEYSEKQERQIRALNVEVTELSDRVATMETNIAAFLERFSGDVGHNDVAGQGGTVGKGKTRNNALQVSTSIR